MSTSEFGSGNIGDSATPELASAFIETVYGMQENKLRYNDAGQIVMQARARQRAAVRFVHSFMLRTNQISTDVHG